MPTRHDDVGSGENRRQSDELGILVAGDPDRGEPHPRQHRRPQRQDDQQRAKAVAPLQASCSQPGPNIFREYKNAEEYSER